MTLSNDFDAKARSWDVDTNKSDRAGRVADAIAGKVPGLAGARVLEYGAGTGLLGFELLGRVGHLTLADSSTEMLAVAREKAQARGAKNVEVIALDLAAGPLPEARYDLVCALLVLHHVPEVDLLLRRFREILRPGGHLCISDLDAEDGSFHGPGFTGHCGFDRVTLVSSLSRAGFVDAQVETVFEIEKPIEGRMRRFTAFLSIARAP
jgi:ubiquinone/menaquinone biosynthesis C-methylase UbiE